MDDGDWNINIVPAGAIGLRCYFLCHFCYTINNNMMPGMCYAVRRALATWFPFAGHFSIH